MVIETERLILRPFAESDATDAFEYLHEPVVHCFASMKVNDPEEARQAVLERGKDGDYYFAITLKENGKVIGEIDASTNTATSCPVLATQATDCLEPNKKQEQHFSLSLKEKRMFITERYWASACFILSLFCF